MRTSPRPRSLPAMLLSLTLLLGCTTAPARNVSTDVITHEAIQSLGATYADAYQVVSRLRPNWVRSRGVSSFTNLEAGFPMVYLDGSRFGAVESLRDIRADQVQSIRFLNPTDATTRYGTGHAGGAILVTTLR
jgi:hypothetical protein